MLQDRDYQTEAVQSIWNYFYQKQGNPLVAMPTGTGKSVVIARFLQSVYRQFPYQRVILLTHVKELIQQNYEKLLMLWPFAPAGVYSAGLNQRDLAQAITFAGIASVWRKAMQFKHIDLVLIDECHLLSPNEQTMYRFFLEALRQINPNLKVIGFTATPWRLGHGHLTDPYEDNKGNITEALFTDVCFDITGLDAFNRLIAEGYLVPLVPKPTKVKFDTDGLHMRMGDFIEKEMQERFGKDEITEAALREAVEMAGDRKHWLIFASGTEHADSVGDMLNLMGIPTGVVHSKRAGRNETIRDFKRGELQAVVNNNVLTTGFDYPEIDLIIVLRATASAVLWVQMLGRGTRPVFGPGGDSTGFDLNTIDGRLEAIHASGKGSCLVLDYARNTERLGPVNDPVIPKRKGQGGGTAPIRLCDRCETYNHISRRYCGGYPYKTEEGCGMEFTFEVKFKETAATDELIRGEMPVVEVFTIDHISADEHRKLGRPPMVKITYYCGYRAFTEYVCVEHLDWAGRKAKKWWSERTDIPMPATTNEALELIDKLKAPTHIRVWTNKKYPEIMSFCFDGSSFGAEEPSPIAPVIESRAKQTIDRNADYVNDLDDDIPF